MIIDDLLNALRADSELATLLEATQDNDKIYAFEAPIEEVPVIVYKFTPITDNKIIRTDRLELTCISDSLGLTYQLDEKIRDIFITYGDDNFNNRVLEIDINGGGSLSDIDSGTYHNTCYFIIDSRS